VYCNYKAITSSYSVTTDRNLSHSMPNVAILFETLKKHVIFKIVTVIRSANTSKFLNNTITVKLLNYTVITLYITLT